MKYQSGQPIHGRTTGRLTLALTTLSSALLLTAANANAQGDAEDQRQARARAVMEEVTITARKREEGLQDTPIAVSAFTGDSLAYRGATRMDDLATFTPNLTIDNNPSFGGASNTAAIYIRGIGQKEFLPTTEPGVGLYVDDVYIARSVGAILDLVDVERVEILRGPQGTLFGRNTIGGAISITSVKPNEEFGGELSATYGTDERMDVKGSVNLPLTDTAFMKITGASLHKDGYVTRDDGVELGDRETLTGRWAFRWLPTDTLEIDLAADITESQESGPAMELIGINLGDPVDPQTPPFAVIHNVGANVMAGGGPVPCATPAMPLNQAVPGCYDYRYVRNDGTSAGTGPAFSDSTIWGLNLSAVWDFTEGMTLKSITAYRDLDSEFGRDGDHSPFEIAHYVDFLEQEQFTQEFQLLGDAFDARVNWILGLYYFEEEGDNENLLNFTISRFRSGGEFDNTSQAAFAQATWDITQRWSLTTGLRYTDEEKTFLPDQVILENKFAGTGDPLLDAPFMQAGQRILPYLEKEINITETTPYINLAFNPTDSLMVYGSYSEGFKSGGFTQRVFPPIVAGFTAPAGTPDIDLIPTFDPEFVEVYELGFKYSTPGQGLRVNGAVFYTEYDDLQVQVFTSVAPVTENAASAEIQGAELEFQAMPVTGLFVEGALGYLNARYDDIDQTETFINPNNDFERVPEWSVSGAVSYEFDLDDIGLLTPRIDWSYKTKTYNDAFNTEALAQGEYHLVNANVALTDPMQTWSVTAGVKNIGDKEYLITGVFGDAMQAIEGMYARGREWYVTAQYNF